MELKSYNEENVLSTAKGNQNELPPGAPTQTQFYGKKSTCAAGSYGMQYFVLSYTTL